MAEEKGKKVRVLVKKLRYYNDKRCREGEIITMYESEIYNTDKNGNKVLSPGLELPDESKPKKATSKVQPVIQDDDVL